jgi:hypothetical protein
MIIGDARNRNRGGALMAYRLHGRNKPSRLGDEESCPRTEGNYDLPGFDQTMVGFDPNHPAIPNS